MAEERQIRRLEKCVDEIVKIHDDGKASERTGRILDMLNSEIATRTNK